jgi:hypothetical protein
MFKGPGERGEKRWKVNRHAYESVCAFASLTMYDSYRLNESQATDSLCNIVQNDTMLWIGKAACIYTGLINSGTELKTK